MYVVLTESKTLQPFTDLMAELVKAFPSEKFSITGSEDMGYKIRIDGLGDEKAPRIFSKMFLKKWRPMKEFSVL